MRIFAIAILGLFVLAGNIPAYAHQVSVTVEPQKVEHGGGCRKSSPPGQCCHMDNSTGSVHCH
ncbi:hypothetical protein TMES_19305 [Thalassospira mesophila]|uniref:Uncharacterized protein n=1 Tax=Thalassospira mesophila TaxID=1293891 RepID=A0A1Y2KYA6_9PROT|nr:hypothetical protein TMES_19305 [Thalassospira mesophila]